MSYWEDKGLYSISTKNGKFTHKEAEFLYYQLASRKDSFEEEMGKGVKSVERLKELSFIMETLDKGIKYFMEQL